MRAAIVLLTTAILFMGITMSMFGTSEHTIEQSRNAKIFTETHQIIMPRQ